MLYLYHGDDEFSRSEAIARLKGEMDPVVGPLNISTMEGRSCSAATLRAICDTMPFMAPWRLVIVHDLLGPLGAGGGKGSRRAANKKSSEDGGEGTRLAEVQEYLPQVPETARLVFNESRALGEKHPFLAQVASLGGEVRAFPLPSGPDLERWIAARAQALGVEIAPPAVALLTTFIGPNPRLLANELEKLATYLGGQGTIGRAEVEALVPAVQEANIFHMTDALGNRDGRRALLLLRRLLADRAAPLYLLTMIVRQFRLLLQAKELDARGASPTEMEREMEVRSFAASSALRQSRNYSTAELKAILAQLLEIDTGIKTGQVDGPVALDLFVARWGNRSPRR